MDIDFEKIRLEVVDKYLSSFTGDDKAARKFFELVTNTSSEIAREMLIKYHQELNKSED